MLELWQTIFAGLTLIVFAVTASVALAQLRHMRVTYQMTNASALLENYWTPQFQSWLRYVFYELEEKVKDPKFCEELRLVPVDKSRHPEIYVCEYYSLIGAYMKNGLMPRDIFFANGSLDAIRAWERLELPVQIMRDADSPIVYRDFELLASQCRAWLAAHA